MNVVVEHGSPPYTSTSQRVNIPGSVSDTVTYLPCLLQLIDMLMLCNVSTNWHDGKNVDLQFCPYFLFPTPTLKFLNLSAEKKKKIITFSAWTVVVHKYGINVELTTAICPVCDDNCLHQIFPLKIYLPPGRGVLHVDICVRTGISRKVRVCVTIHCTPCQVFVIIIIAYLCGWFS